MEKTVLINFDSGLNGMSTSSFQSSPAWDVVFSEELSLPLSCNTQQKQRYSDQEILNTEKPVLEQMLYKTEKCFRTPCKCKKCSLEERELGPDCKCPSKCFKKIGEETISKIFNDFCALPDYNSQNAYLYGLINLVGVKRRYTNKRTSRRNFTVVYHVKDKDRNVPVCKKAFLNIHGLQRSRGRINNLANKMKDGESVPSPDKRGRHTNRPNAYSQEAIEHVRRHLLRCPKTDLKNSSKSSKVMVFSAKRCYALYVNEYCRSNGLMPVSLDKFRRIFVMEGYKSKSFQKSGK